MKYYVFFHTVTGHDIRATMSFDKEVDLEATCDAVANEIASMKFFHHVEDGKFTIVNMRNVAYVTISKAT